jgi:AcrR family transcriptional regulator
MSITERKERDRKKMVDLILNAAMKLFLEDGYNNVTIRKIAKVIEYSPATIYLYFTDKDEIFFTLQKRAFTKFHELQKSVLVIKDPVERITAQGWSYIKFALENKEYYDLMFIMNDPVRKIQCQDDIIMGMHSYEILKKNVKDCMDAGAMKLNDVEIVSFAIWSFVHGIASLVIKRGFAIPEEQQEILINGAFDFFSHLITK